jgi:hypothetical protein
VIGLYCHNCGQENIEPKESVWHLVTHFFQDITHFDGKFFTSMKLLILKPGFLSREYMLGRRASYLNPVRMYLFTSAIFFLIFFSLYKVDEKSLSVNPSAMGINYNELDKIDSVKLDRLTRKFNDGKPMTKEEVRKKMNANTFSLSPSTYKKKKQ